jgi:hypothetical protein
MISQKHKNFIISLAARIVSRDDGVGKVLNPFPRTQPEWNKCLGSISGWVDIGVDDNLADILREFNIGEVIPRLESDKTIFKNTYCNQLISKCLGLTKKDRRYRAILNYNSFKKLLKIIENYHKDKRFIDDVKETYASVVPRVFWVNLEIPEEIKLYLESNNIGEIINKEGETDIIKNGYDMERTIINWDDDNTQMKYDEKIEYEDTPFRFIVNNQTLLKLINYACLLKEVKPDQSLYEIMSQEEDEDISKLLSNLSL